jgi:hypothetical protein
MENRRKVKQLEQRIYGLKIVESQSVQMENFRKVRQL